MSKDVPTVQKYMSYDPVSIASDKTIVEAQDMMKKHDIRHLPVMENDNIIGILSDRDIKLALSLIQPDHYIEVQHICHHHVYQVDPDTHIDLVAQEMAEKHYGCTVIVQNGHLVGIFTTVDACRALADISRQRHH